MIIMPGRCIKCANVIIPDGKVGYNCGEIIFELKSYDRRDKGIGYLHIGICTTCTISKKEFSEVLAAQNDWSVAHGGKAITERRITKITGRLNTVALRMRQQGNRCIGCHKKFETGDKYISTGDGLVMHEFCNMKPLKHRLDNPRTMGNVSEEEIKKAAKRGGGPRKKARSPKVTKRRS